MGNNKQAKITNLKNTVLKYIALDILSIGAFAGMMSVMHSGSTVLDAAIAGIVVVFAAEKLW